MGVSGEESASRTQKGAVRASSRWTISARVAPQRESLRAVILATGSVALPSWHWSAAQKGKSRRIYAQRPIAKLIRHSNCSSGAIGDISETFAAYPLYDGGQRAAAES
jgi:hypothetical protein